MRVNLTTILSIAVISISVAMIAPASAQKSPGNKDVSAPSKSSDNFDSNNPNCPPGIAVTGCGHKTPLPRVTSKTDCECQIRRVRSGNRILLIKDCYVQLPNDTVFFCKEPI